MTKTIEKTAAERVIEKFGNANRLALECGIQVATVYRWTYPKQRRGSNGLIPASYHQVIWDTAKRLGIKLRKDDFVNL